MLRLKNVCKVIRGLRLCINLIAFLAGILLFVTAIVVFTSDVNIVYRLLQMIVVCAIMLIVVKITQQLLSRHVDRKLKSILKEAILKKMKKDKVYGTLVTKLTKNSLCKKRIYNIELYVAGRNLIGSSARKMLDSYEQGISSITGENTKINFIEKQITLGYNI